MSLRIVYSQDFTIQPRYRKKKGITENERNRNVRRLKMFDRAQTPSDSGGGRVQPEQADKTDISECTTQRVLREASNHPSAADPPPPYSESQDNGLAPPPTYDAAHGGQASAREA